MWLLMGLAFDCFHEESANSSVKPCLVTVVTDRLSLRATSSSVGDFGSLLALNKMTRSLSMQSAWLRICFLVLSEVMIK